MRNGNSFLKLDFPRSYLPSSFLHYSYVEELENSPDIDRNETLGHFIKSRGYSELFLKAYLVGC